ncbi:hypothetical protein RBH26_11260 [Natronolimnohabitans sp. A-GB9]|nr:hypothetical protein [Natronolimnohabitans sp. A-GB9]MDQ2051058.1 hypothetical protein [Natronolimnohabitans sp. A-GB9]
MSDEPRQGEATAAVADRPRAAGDSYEQRRAFAPRPVRAGSIDVADGGRP